MKLLLVDDDAFLRDMYATKFAECGHVIEAADSAVDALQKIQQNPNFDVVLLDMIMPGMGGVELISAIKERFPDMKAKYIVLSNQGQHEDIEEAKQAGSDGYIIKAECIPSQVVKKVEAIASKT